MRFSPSPDLSSTRRVLLTALAVWLVVVSILAIRYGAQTLVRLGDTDNAMRLVLVRDLLAGRGWYDQLITRLQPPAGAYMHWSRLLDGALAAMVWLLSRVTTPQNAELATRFIWPMLWIFPALACALAIARNLGARAAVLIAAVLMVFDFQLYRQFLPGRIDHHNVQITMAVAALACVTARSHRTALAALAGAASALGLAIGLEALAFHALIGAAYAIAVARDRGEAAPTRAYGVSLAIAAACFYALQTPPWRWSLSFCDAIGANLVLALVVGGLGLALVATFSTRLPAAARAGAVVLVGLAAAAVYLSLHPACVRGPFDALDPRVRSFWFDRIQEIAPWPRLLANNRPVAIRAMVLMVMALAAAAFLVLRSWRRPQPNAVLALGLLAVASVAAFSAQRMGDYVYWFGFPVLAAAASVIAARRLKDLMVPTVLAAAVASPLVIFLAITLCADAIWPRPAAPPTPSARACFATAAYARLAALPRGLVLGETDLGPYVLANSPHSAVTAPYHRLSASILAAHEAQAAPPPLAEARVRALGADYVLACRDLPTVSAPASLAGQLRLGQAPPWLERLTPLTETLQIYRVRPR
ncbi:MAG TPA: hypothetical protein VFE03_13405 [Caulobacteraceae bacterium]|nr:hypothetical protein [Caulobacteraceae bacterium]